MRDEYWTYYGISLLTFIPVRLMTSQRPVEEKMRSYGGNAIELMFVGASIMLYTAWSHIL